MVKQRTIRKPVSITGVGLQTGGKVTLSLKPAPAGTGIRFVRVDLTGSPVLNLRSIELGESDPALRRTALGTGLLQIDTTEHFLAALSGLSIENLTVELSGAELPGLDGSSGEFVTLLESAGVCEQDEPRRYLKIGTAIRCEGKDSFIAIFPDEKFRISYTLSYKSPAIGTQFYSIVLDEETFKKEIAPARTFCLEEEAAQLLKMGLGKGANYDNTLVMGKAGPIKTSLRFPDEPVRHKILDLIGDLYVLGMPLMGHVVAIKSGHRLNMELVEKLKAQNSLPAGRQGDSHGQ